jgi:hypothetical protein
VNGLFDALNRLVDSSDARDPHVVSQRERLSEALTASGAPWASLAVTQLRSYRRGKARAVIDTTQSEVCLPTNLIVAEINQKSGPHLVFEWLYFTDAKETPRLHERFPSKSRPINIAACSQRLEVEYKGRIPRVRSVAIFPEDWRFPTPKLITQLNDWDVLFFVDRFRLRTETYSWPLLERGLAESTFPNLRSLFVTDSDDLSERLCSDWLGPHERNHRSGSIPLTVTADDDFRIFKDNRPAGAFEEMRADVNAILELHSNISDDGYEQCVGEFIALERLFRYPVQHLVEKNTFHTSKRLDYDSIGSQLLARFLTNAGHLEIINGRVSLKADYLQGLAEYAALAEKIQEEALEIADATAGDEWKKKGAGRRHISNFVRNAAGYDTTANDFVVDPLFHHLAETVVDYPNPRIAEGGDTAS